MINNIRMGSPVIQLVQVIAESYEPFGKMNELTVIIPTFNMQDGVVQAIDSVLAAEISVDIVVVDDCSVPPVVLPGRLQTLKNLSLVRHGKNMGAAAARNSGVGAAQTRWISFLDSDDLMLGEHLPARLAFAQSIQAEQTHQLALFGCGWFEPEHDGEGGLNRTPLGAETAEVFASGCWYCPGSCIIALREVFEAYPFDESLRRLEDFDFGIRFGLAGGVLHVQNLIGAVIDRANKTNATQVEHAAFSILKKHRSFLETHRKVGRALRGYLQLEMAAINYHDKKFLRMIRHLLASVWHKPRTKLHFSPGWIVQKAEMKGRRGATT